MKRIIFILALFLTSAIALHAQMNLAIEKIVREADIADRCTNYIVYNDTNTGRQMYQISFNKKDCAQLCERIKKALSDDRAKATKVSESRSKGQVTINYRIQDENGNECNIAYFEHGKKVDITICRVKRPKAKPQGFNPLSPNINIPDSELKELLNESAKLLNESAELLEELPVTHGGVIISYTTSNSK
jgi:hypothetical protein